MSQALRSHLSRAYDVGQVQSTKVIILVAIAVRFSSRTLAYSLVCLSFDLSILQQSFSKANRQQKVLFLGALVPPLPSVGMEFALLQALLREHHKAARRYGYLIHRPQWQLLA